MNVKYAEKPNPNPNEPIKAICGKLHLYAERWTLYAERCTLDAAHKNEPNFFTTKYALLNQKRRNGGQKSNPKNETNPISESKFLQNRNLFETSFINRYTIIPFCFCWEK
jgi:hypothetical protein